jgi:hypothetical protein
MSAALAACLALLVSACSEAPGRIQLGPLPARPIDLHANDAGQELPDGAIPCDTPADCDDGIDCTRDECLPQGYCRVTTDYTRCDDGKFCNGIEICDATQGCIPGVVPSCDDLDPCTIDRCDDDARECVYAPRDFDHDGETDVHCPGGTDCDDFDIGRGSHLMEICGDLLDNDCDDLVDEDDCGNPKYDTCEDALDISQGGAFEVSALGAQPNYVASCTEFADTPDLVFTFQLDEPRDLQLQARGIFPDGNDEVATLALQTHCGLASSELQCARGFPANLRVRALPAGRYYVIGNSFQSRSLWLSMKTLPATSAPTNTTCENALDVGKGGRFEGDFVDVGDETLSVCGVANQPDVFYSFTLTKESDVEISAVSDEPGDLTISVRDSCDPMATVRGCRSAEPALTRLHKLPAGHYIIALEGPTSREVNYALEVAILDPTDPPAGDGCGNSMQLTAGTPMQVSLADKQAEVKSSCESNGPDAVFKLDLDSARDVVIRVDAEDTQLAVAALQSTCGDVNSERGCRKGGPLETRLRNVDPGEYYVVVDSPNAAAVTVQVETYPPTPTTPASGNDNCMSAQLIPETGGIFSGDTRDLLADYVASCGAGAASKDAVFKLVLTTRRHVVARLDSGFDGVLHRMRDDRTGPDVCKDVVSDNCSVHTGGGTGALLDEVLSAGTYYYVVDGYRDFNAGYYQLDVAVGLP